jgi:hypothetical protein
LPSFRQYLFTFSCSVAARLALPLDMGVIVRRKPGICAA